jgi:glycosyltransferase involved in cell wall biosynthesis
LVSIIIPTYNRAHYLKEAINSVHQQSYRPIECIVVDDGSTDHTAELVDTIKNLTSDNFIIKYVLQNNSGAQVARNKGTELASGEFIQYLDSDDLLYPDKLSNQIRFLEDHPDCDGVFGDWEQGQPSDKEIIKGYLSENPIEQFLTDRCIANFSFLMRTEMIKKTGQWDPNIKRNQEIDFHVRALLKGARFSYVPGTTGLWRTHNEIRIANSTNLKDVVFFFQKMENLLTEKKLFANNLKEKIASLYMWLVDENIKQPKSLLVPAINEAYRLNPNINFAQKTTFRLINQYFGLSAAISVWLFIRKNLKCYSRF